MIDIDSSDPAFGHAGPTAGVLALAAAGAAGDKELRASEARLRSLIDNMLGGLITFDARGVIESVNPAAARIFGYASAELVGRSVGILVPEEAAAASARGYLARIFRASIGRVTELPARRKNGEVFPLGLSVFQFGTSAWKRFAFTMRDLSERRESERLKNEFVASVSHELRTPLTSIRGSLALLGGEAGEISAPESRELIAVADRNCIRLIGLIDSLLDFEKLGRGTLEMVLSRVSLSDVLERALEAVRGFAVAQGVALDLAPADGEVVVLGDRERLVQVAVNLLSNAVKFSPRGAAVQISAAARDGSGEVRVSDRGRGIPPRLREAVFERFRQVEASDARDKGGTGLGLAIAKGIVEQHNGKIGVESEEGVGSTFWFRLPLALAAAAGGRR